MKKRPKSILAFAFLGGIMVTSGVVIAIPGAEPNDPNQTFTKTGTPADNFPDEQRAQFCGNGTAGSTAYVSEYHVPTECTQPLAMASDPDGNIWFVQANTGNIARFDPGSGNFSEYDNPAWPDGATSMVWGLDYSSDHSFWYTDETYDSVWRFSIDDEEYNRLDFPSTGNSLPQRIMIDGSQVIINDFTGSQLVFMDASAHADDASPVTVKSPLPRSVTAAFAKNPDSTIWYTNWIPERGGILVHFDHPRYVVDLRNADAGTAASGGPDIRGYVASFNLPPGSAAINGIVADDTGVVWLADSASSNFYSFNPGTQSYTVYATSPVPESTYGNQTGLIKTPPASRPYWIATNDAGNIVFNEETANRIGVFDPRTERLVEYNIPSANPEWYDCDGMPGCGISQALDFITVGDKIWFSGWVTNNIGVIDTSIAPEIDVGVGNDLVYYGNDTSVTMTVESRSDSVITLVSGGGAGDLVTLEPSDPWTGLLADGESADVSFDISVADELPPGRYKVLLGAMTPDIAVSEFFTLAVGEDPNQALIDEIRRQIASGELPIEDVQDIPLPPDADTTAPAGGDDGDGMTPDDGMMDGADDDNNGMMDGADDNGDGDTSDGAEDDASPAPSSQEP